MQCPWCLRGNLNVNYINISGNRMRIIQCLICRKGLMQDDAETKHVLEDAVNILHKALHPIEEESIFSCKEVFDHPLTNNGPKLKREGFQKLMKTCWEDVLFLREQVQSNTSLTSCEDLLNAMKKYKDLEARWKTTYEEPALARKKYFDALEDFVSNIETTLIQQNRTISHNYKDGIKKHLAHLEELKVPMIF